MAAFLCDPESLALGVVVVDEVRGDVCGHRLESSVPVVFLVVEDAVAVDDPAYVAWAMGADREREICVFSCAAHCSAGLENVIEVIHGWI